MAVISLPTGMRAVDMATNDKEIIKEQLRLMADRIQTEGNKMCREKLIIEYDNGGGQSGLRENPYYPAYEKLINTYIKTLAAAKELCGTDDEEIRNLDSIRARFKVVK